MFATSHLSTKGLVERDFLLINDSIKTILSTSDNTDDCSYNVNKVIVGGSDVNIKKATKKADSTLNKNIAASELCMEIEKNLSSVLCQLDGNAIESDSPVLIIRKKLAVYDENGLRKRIRRKPEELLGEKNHICPYSHCEKTYTSKCSLYLHIKRNHGEDEKVKDGEIAPVRTNSKVKKGVNIYKVFKKSQAEKYECRINFESATMDLSEREKQSFSDCTSKLNYRSSPNSSAKTSVDLTSCSKLDSTLKKYFSQDFTSEQKLEDVKENYAREEIFSCEDKTSRNASFDLFRDDFMNKYENMSDEVVSVLCLDFESDGAYEYSVSEEELIYENIPNVQGEVNANDELSGLIFNNTGSNHLAKTEYEFLEFEDQNENDFTNLCNYEVVLNENNTPFSLFI